MLGFFLNVDDSETTRKGDQMEAESGTRAKQTGRTDSERTPRGRMKGDDEGEKKKKKRPR
jgi:hypothetical protein